MSNLMQEILTQVEKYGADASAAVLKHSGLIYEAEALRDQLHKTGLTKCEPTFLTHGAIVFYDHDPKTRMREALEAIGVELEDSSCHFACELPPNTRITILTLKGLACRVWINYDPLPLAEAA